jgi:hypothetical protein
MTKKITEWAAAAAEIRKALKAHGIQCKVTSDAYAGGSSVKVRVYDQSPAVVERITRHCGQYQYGHFNGMEDIYEATNMRDDIPQVSFVFVDNEISPELQAEITEYCDARWEYYSDQNRREVIYREMRNTGSQFWASRKARLVIPAKSDERSAA